jgi:HAE1 family hydrophobic/amphiphilic exporter-1
VRFDRGAEGLFGVTVRRPVAILMVTLAAVVFGFFSYRRLPVELMPDISYPSLTVRTEYNGAAPQEVEENVTRLLEEALGVVGGLVRMSSISRADLSDVTLEFTWDTSMNQAWQEVTERLDTVYLPEDAEKPLILRYDPSLEPVIRLALASTREKDQSPEGLKRLRTFAELELERRLEQVAGVAAVRVLGGLEEQISVELNEEELRRTGLSIQEVARRLSVENVNLAGGDIKEGDTQYLVRTVNEFGSVEEIADLVVARSGGREFRLRDLGRVRSGWADREVITRLRQNEAVEIEIQKEADANIVAMASAVREALEGRPGQGALPAEQGLTGLLPEGWTLELITDRSTFIRASVDEVRNTAILGGLLAVLVLYLFLRDFRSTAVVSLAIPVSVAAVFAPMNLSGLSLNIMSLGGLALGIGMLVDSGIVVVESIARCREEGDEPARAVVRGTSEVGTAVVASTLTTVAVFFPMVFVEGVAGQVFKDLALTVVFALLASLAVSVFLVPALTARVMAGSGGDKLSLRDRLARVLRYRSLGPISRPEPSGALRFVSRATLAAPVLAAIAVVLSPLSRRLIGPGTVWLGVAAALVLIGGGVVLLNFAIRLRESTGLLGILAALALIPIEAALFPLETAWLALVCLLTVVVGPLAALIHWSGRLLRFLLWPLIGLFDALFPRVQKVYPAIVRGALRRPGRVLAVAAAGLVLMGLGFTRLDSSLIPEVHQGEFDLEITLPVGTPLEETLKTVAPLERWALEEPRVDRVLLRVGADPEADSDPEEGEHTARLTLTLAEPVAASWKDSISLSLRRIRYALTRAEVGGIGGVREEGLIEEVRRLLDGMPELQGKITRPVLFSFRTPIEVEVEGYDLAQLRDLGEAARRELEAIPGLADVKSTARQGSPEVQIEYDRQALVRLGLDLREVADLVRTKVKGSAATEYRKRERRIDIVVRLGEADRSTVRQLRNLVINPGAQVPIPLSAVAEVKLAAGPADIRRMGQRRVALLQANLAGGGLSRAGRAIEQRLDGLDWPEGTSWRLAGQVQEMERSLGSLWQALLLSVFLVYVVMASQFESLLHPLLIMVTVPLALLGVVLALWLLSIPLSVVVFLGMIMLAGIVVNNAIVMVDYVNTLRRRGLGVEEALVEAGSVRLRPILMTTATTVLGLLPMSLGLGDGAEIRTPMALTVIAGLLSSTLLTLVVLPTAYAALESARGLFSRRPHSADGAAAATERPS